MKRRVFTLAAALSLLLCVATVMLWVRSYYCVDEISREVSEIHGPVNAGRVETWYFGSRLGGIYLADSRYSFVESHDTIAGHIVTHRYANDDPEEAPSDWPLHYSLEANGEFVPIQPDWSRLGFRWGRGSSALGSLRYAVLPHWLLALAFGVMPGTAIVRTIRARSRAAIGACPTCGYDLRATPDRCPECGTDAVAKR